MTKPRAKTREELTAEIEESKKKIRQYQNREKIIKQKLLQKKQKRKKMPQMRRYHIWQEIQSSSPFR